MYGDDRDPPISYIGAYVESYFDVISICDMCTQCGERLVSEEIAPIFEWMGYSACTFGKTYSITQGYYVNQDSVAAYKEYAPDFDYAILAAVNTEEKEDFEPKPGEQGVLTGTFIKNANDYLDVKVSGIPADKGDALVVFCVYVKVNGEIFYLDGGVMGTTVMGVSYNSIANNAK